MRIGDKKQGEDAKYTRNKRGEEYAAVLVSKDRRSTILGGHVVPNKGASTEWVIKTIVSRFGKDWTFEFCYITE